MTLNNLNKKLIPFFIGALFIAATYLIFLCPVDTFVALTDEDGLVEMVGAFFFLLAAGLFFYSFFKSRIRGNAWFRQWSWAYFFLGLLFLLAFGEEISWGQRIFGWETPAALQEVNVQQEFNFHNLKWFEPGEHRQGYEKYITAKWLFTDFGFFYLLLIPLLYPTFTKIRKICDKFRLPIPPLRVGALFFLNIFLSKGVEKLMLSDGDVSLLHAIKITHSTVELMESNWALIIAILAVVFLTDQKKTIEI